MPRWLRMVRVVLAGTVPALAASAWQPAAAQAPGPTAANPWLQLAPFPEPSEEVLGTPWLMEGGKGSKPRAVHIQLRPDPLAH